MTRTKQRPAAAKLEAKQDCTISFIIVMSVNRFVCLTIW